MWIFITLFHIGHMHYMHQFSSVQFGRSVVSDSATPWIAAHQAPLSITNSRSSPRLTSIESVMPSSHLNLCRPLLHLPPVPPSIRVFSNESTLHMRWPKDWSFSFSIIPSKEIPGMIYFRMDWLDLLAVQGTLKSLLQHHSSKASILQCSAFFTVQRSYPYMTTGRHFLFNISIPATALHRFYCLNLLYMDLYFCAANFFLFKCGALLFKLVFDPGYPQGKVVTTEMKRIKRIWFLSFKSKQTIDLGKHFQNEFWPQQKRQILGLRV